MRCSGSSGSRGRRTAVVAQGSARMRRRACGTHAPPCMWRACAAVHVACMRCRACGTHALPYVWHERTQLRHGTPPPPLAVCRAGEAAVGAEPCQVPVHKGVQRLQSAKYLCTRVCSEWPSRSAALLLGWPVVDRLRHSSESHQVTWSAMSTLCHHGIRHADVWITVITVITK